MSYESLRHFTAGDKVEEIGGSYFVTFLCSNFNELLLCSDRWKEMQIKRERWRQSLIFLSFTLLLHKNAHFSCQLFLGLHLCVLLHSFAITPYLCAQQLRVCLSE